MNKIKDLTHLSWNISGMGGSFLKSADAGIFYKLSNYDPFLGITGHECINEIIADRLMTVLGIDHIRYELIHACILIDGREYVTWLCSTENFRRSSESKTSFESFHKSNHMNHEKMMAFIERFGWEEEIYKMLIVDFLILNRDRHGANMEVLIDSVSHTIRLSPLFDNGLSLLFSCKDLKSLEQYGILEDKPVQCFAGSGSTLKNLNLITKFPHLNPLKESDFAFIFKGLDEAMDERWLEKIQKMIWARWNLYEDFRNQKL